MSFIKLEETEVVDEYARFSVHHARFKHPDGKTVARQWVDPGNVVAVLPYDGEYFYLGRQPREITGGYQLGLCAGKIDDGENPLAAAKRELVEEMGIQASHWALLDEFYSSEGFTSEYCHVYLAAGSLDFDSPTDLEERVDVVKVHMLELPYAIDRVTNAKAKIALLRLLQTERGWYE